MSLIGGLVGGMIGFTFLGPLGALIGSVIGSRMSGNSVRRKNPNNFDHQLAFFAALFACLAKIARGRRPQSFHRRARHRIDLFECDSPLARSQLDHLRPRAQTDS